MPWLPLTLDSDVRKAHGVGPERAEQLEKLKIRTIHDLLRLRPRRYEDRRHSDRIMDVREGVAVTVRGEIVAMGLKRFRRGTRSVFELILDDGSARLHCRWWNLPFLTRVFRQGQEIFAHGKVTSLKPRAMEHPETEVVEADETDSVHLHRITPIYPLTEGLPQRWLRDLMWRVVEETLPRLQETWPELDLGEHPSLREAYRSLHFPETFQDAEKARRRLALEEFLELQSELHRRRRHLLTAAEGLPCGGDNRWQRPFLSALGWKLTRAQTRVLKEVRQDMAGGHPMRRLVQGDVGSGKTVVAACASLMALESGFSVVLMAPTEILAEQHHRVFCRWFEPLGLRVDLHTGKSPSMARRGGKVLEDGQEPRLVVGTHALVDQGFQLEGLGLVVIDEQHKFGVSQREMLVRKGKYPHLLVMTATPIPRTLGLTLYGDLDLSVVDELPGGRGQVRTYVRAPASLPKLLEFMREKLAEGRQAYVVCARVDEKGPGSWKAVTREFERYREALSPHAVGLLHGRMPAEEKDCTMNAFRDGTLRVLVATTVIEVGVDVPNATLMVIENADQFGLAQLHQLRGRIGRGSEDAFCVLMAEPKTDEARRRMEVMVQTRDGFVIAEEDLKLRGPGEFLGRNQSGLPPFRFADLVHDGDILLQARQLAQRRP